MGVIAGLKFLKNDSRFTRNDYIFVLGGKKRIKQFQEMDGQFIKELKFYYSKISNTAFWNNPQNIEDAVINLEHLAASLRKECAFNTQLMQVAGKEKMEKEQQALLDVGSRLFSAKSEVEAAIEKLKHWPDAKYAAKHLVVAWRWLE